MSTLRSNACSAYHLIFINSSRCVELHRSSRIGAIRLSSNSKPWQAFLAHHSRHIVSNQGAIERRPGSLPRGHDRLHGGFTHGSITDSVPSATKSPLRAVPQPPASFHVLPVGHSEYSVGNTPLPRLSLYASHCCGFVCAKASACLVGMVTSSGHCIRRGSIVVRGMSRVVLVRFLSQDVSQAMHSLKC
jgi:hypothetical protein